MSYRSQVASFIVACAAVMASNTALSEAVGRDVGYGITYQAQSADDQRRERLIEAQDRADKRLDEQARAAKKRMFEYATKDMTGEESREFIQEYNRQEQDEIRRLLEAQRKSPAQPSSSKERVQMLLDQKVARQKLVRRQQEALIAEWGAR